MYAVCIALAYANVVGCLCSVYVCSIALAYANIRPTAQGFCTRNKKARMLYTYALYVFKLLALITQLLYNVLVQAQHSCRFGCIACSVHLR